MLKKILVFARVLRISQWIKNLIVFTAIIFSGNLFEKQAFLNTLYAFFVFCFLSSTSYVLNDIIDYPYDKKHRIKKFRPIASGEISIQQATFIVFIMSLISLFLSLVFSLPLFFLSLIFLLLHFFYSLYLKKYPVIDIFTISLSFVIRSYVGVVVTGWYIQIWMMLTIFFLSLFMASVKRHAEIVSQGLKARLSLYRYNEHFLDFLTYTAATATIISYSFYTYFEKIPSIKTIFGDFFSKYFPQLEARKLMMITIPLVVYGITRYAQLLYEKYEGERPEKLITSDIPLIITIAFWGGIIISLIYLF